MSDPDEPNANTIDYPERADEPPVKPWKRDLAYIREVGPDELRFDEAVQRVWDELEVAQKRVSSHYYVDRDYHNDYVGRLEGRIAELKDRCEELGAERDDAVQILREHEYMVNNSSGQMTEGKGECLVCGWPQDGHPGPGRYKGNVENTHEEGCSLDAVLNGRPAHRLRHRREALS